MVLGKPTLNRSMHRVSRTWFPEFVRLRRRWFVVLLVVNFLVGFLVIGRNYHSVTEIAGMTVVFSVVATTLISLLSAPVLFFIARRRVARKESEP